LRIRLTGIDGKVNITLVDDFQAAGKKTIALDNNGLTDLPAGIYMLSFETDSGVMLKQVNIF
jgi:hypothetical protein